MNSLRLSGYAVVWLSVACAPSRVHDAGPLPSPRVSPASLEPVTWYRDVRPVIREHCQSCHQPDSVAPFSLLSYESAKEHQADVLDAVRTGFMPPWLPSNDCQPFRARPVLHAHQAQTLVDWAEAGAPSGVSVPDASAVPQRPFDQLLTTDEYAPAETEVRCFSFELLPAQVREVTAFKIRRGRGVSEVTLFQMPTAQARKLDGLGRGRGWACPNEPAAGRRLLGAWVPGAPVTELPEGTGLPLSATDSVVVQAVYRRGAPASETADPRTTVSLRYADMPVLPAKWVAYTRPAFSIPPKSSGFTLSSPLTLPTQGKLWGVMPRLGELGRRFRIGRAAGCVIDIPLWEYSIRGAYFFETPLVAQKPETFSVSCSWNNGSTAKVSSSEPQGERCGAWLYFTEAAER